MRNTRLFALLVMLIALTAASAPPSATAEAIHCPALTLNSHTVGGGCLIHLTSGSFEIRKHAFGVEVHVTNCDMELDARFDEDGQGYFTAVTMSGESCQRRACLEAGGGQIPWQFSASEAGVGNEVLDLTLCVEPSAGGTDENCEIDFPLTSPAAGDYEFGDADGEVSGDVMGTFTTKCELLGHWETEAVRGPGEIEMGVSHV
jgi:hypothetical protein